MYRKNYFEVLIYFFLFITFLASRLPKLGAFSTLDEPYWLSMGANFYYALGQREFQNTVYEYQPAVTTMWIVTMGMLYYFPEYRGLGQGYLEFEKGALDPFMLAHNKDPLMLLQDTRFIQVFLISFLFLLLYYLLQHIFSKPIAIFVVLFASFDPYLFGQSRLLNHEGMLALFVTLSIVSFYVFSFIDKRIRFLIFSGVMSGLAQLTKSSAIAILFPIATLLVFQIILDRENGLVKSVFMQTKNLLVWLIINLITYVVVWPGMWVAPKDMLYVVYGNAFSYAFHGARLSVTEELQPARFSVNTSLLGIWNLTKVILWRTTPITWLGILFGCFPRFTFPNGTPNKTLKYFLVLLMITALAFIIMFGFAQGRNSPHYLLTCYLVLNLFSALGWYFLFELISQKINLSMKMQLIGLILLICFQLGSTLSFYPYYYTYRNPILYDVGLYSQFPQKPYGEGLEKAAQYLATLPDAKDSVALTYYARGCFSFFYPGETTRFKPYYVDNGYESEFFEALQSADYLVVYYAAQIQSDRYDSFFETLSEVKPMYEVWLDDYKYVLIYDLNVIPPSIIDKLAN